MQLGPNMLMSALVLQLLACWPVVRWYGMRTLDTSDAPWGLIALGTAGLFLFIKRPFRMPARAELTVPTLLLLLYAATFHFLPPLLRAALAVSALGCTATLCSFGRAMQPGLSGLLLLALPMVPTMQFYLGYPLRVAAGALAAPLLQLAGFPVVREGTVLNWCGKLVCIDAPCSGIKMLWVGLYLTFTLAAFYEFPLRKTMYSALFCLLVVVAANAFRSAALFFVEADLFPFPAWFHSGAGLVVFFFAALAIAWFNLKLNKDLPCAH